MQDDTNHMTAILMFYQNFIFHETHKYMKAILTPSHNHDIRVIIKSLLLNKLNYKSYQHSEISNTQLPLRRQNLTEIS